MNPTTHTLPDGRQIIIRWREPYYHWALHRPAGAWTDAGHALTPGDALRDAEHAAREQEAA